MAGFAAFAALYLHMVDGLFDADLRALLRLIPIFMVIAAAAFGWFGVHRSSWRYASVSELWLIIMLWRRRIRDHRVGRGALLQALRARASPRDGVEHAG